VTTDIRIEDATPVPLRGLKPHPLNARRGNLDLIEESLGIHGQYSPIVITQDNVILAGHHVVKAARRLKWSKIDAVRVTVTDEQALGILLADNRTTDLATYDNPALLNVLAGLPDLKGTGFGQADIDTLNALIYGGEPPEEPGGGEPEPKGTTITVIIRLGVHYRWEIDKAEYEAWHENVLGDVPRSHAIRTLKSMLQMPVPPPPEPSPTAVTATEVALADPADLRLHPDNPREGDIGAIADALRAYGQYRPIVANIQTGNVVKGNHTLQAIRALKWEQVAVCWINVSEDEETRIMLMDNRASDLATYSTEDLVTALKQARLDGTGYTGSDLDDLIRGGASMPGPVPTGQTQCKIGQYGWRMPTDAYEAWADGLDGSVIWHRLRLPEETA
jgi:ParB-like chromosome segregation protein Spo0J